MKVSCDRCGGACEKDTGHVNRSKRLGFALYCSRVCMGLSRRKNLTIAQKKEAKRLYDIKYRRANLAKIKARKAEYFKRDYNANPEKYKAIRKKTSAYHAEYCRSPAQKEKTRERDKKRYAQTTFGPLWEIHYLAMKIDDEAQKQMNKHEIMQSKGTINKSQKRKRNYEKIKRC